MTEVKAYDTCYRYFIFRTAIMLILIKEIEITIIIIMKSHVMHCTTLQHSSCNIKIASSNLASITSHLFSIFYVYQTLYEFFHLISRMIQYLIY